MKDKDEIAEAARKLLEMTKMGVLDPEPEEGLPDFIHGMRCAALRSHQLGLYTALAWVLSETDISFPDFLNSEEAGEIRVKFLPDPDNENNPSFPVGNG